jgi:hypothetical protein
MRQKSFMKRLLTMAILAIAALLLQTGAIGGRAEAQQSGGGAGSNGGSTSSASGGATGATDEASRTVPPAIRGKKLVLKNGDFQLVRSYERQGEKVRYLSAERGDWEEIPAAMVDWEATAKAAKADDAAASSLVQHVHQQQVEAGAEVPTDVDASLRVGAGVFLPEGAGMFAVQGKWVQKMEEVGSQTKVDKKRVIEQVLSPMPVVPSKHNIVIAGAHATLRLTLKTDPLEFYMREEPPDPDNPSPKAVNSTGTDAGPEVVLVHATVKGGKRELESFRTLFGQDAGTTVKTVAIQRWDVASRIYRFTLGEALQPGEYALAEMLPDGLNVYVWDFGVDASK